MNVIKPLPHIELVVKAFVTKRFGPEQPVGGSLKGKPEDGYIRIAKVPGGSRSNRFEGTFAVDIEVFDRSYWAAESRALDLEAALLGYPHSVEVDGETVVLDSIEQNAGPAETFWDDPSVSRILSTYVITIRR